MASIHNSAVQSMMYNVFTVRINHSYIIIKNTPSSTSRVVWMSVWRFTDVSDVNIVL